MCVCVCALVEKLCGQPGSDAGVAADRLINSSEGGYFCRVTKAGVLVCAREKLFPGD